jgi:hypothetical protein
MIFQLKRRTESVVTSKETVEGRRETEKGSRATYLPTSV